MPAKDHYYKKLEDYNDVFSDLINVLLFHGRPVVQEDELVSGLVHSAYEVEKNFNLQERDAKKYWKKGGVRLSVYGLENQTGEDPDFMCRVLPYDAAEYRDQVRERTRIRRENTRIRKNTPAGEDPQLLPVPDFYPAVSLLLYFGDTHWRGSLHLKDHLRIPKGLEEYVSDYTTNLFEIAFLTDEQVAMFQSDFRFVAEYFVAARKKKEGLQPTFHLTLDHLQHVEAFIELMNAVTNSRRFSDLPDFIKRRGGSTVLTVFFDEAEERGIAKGEAIGEARGEAIGEARGIVKKLINLIMRKQAAGQSAAKIAEDLMEDASLVNKLYDLIDRNRNATSDQIYEMYMAEGESKIEENIYRSK